MRQARPVKITRLRELMEITARPSTGEDLRQTSMPSGGRRRVYLGLRQPSGPCPRDWGVSASAESESRAEEDCPASLRVSPAELLTRLPSRSATAGVSSQTTPNVHACFARSEVIAGLPRSRYCLDRPQSTSGMGCGQAFCGTSQDRVEIYVR